MAEPITCGLKLMNTAVIKMTCPFKGYKDHSHKGVDLIPKSTSETPYIYSLTDGIVIAVGKTSTVNKSTGTTGCGTYVAVEASSGIMVRYQHLKANSLKVTKGDKVTKGQILGTYGRPTTGNSSGPHLHLDVSYTTKPSEPYLSSQFCNKTRYYVDPLPFLAGSKSFEGKTISKNTKTTTAPLNVRSGPGISYNKIRTIPAGTKVTVYETKNGFCRIGSGEWCSASYLK